MVAGAPLLLGHPASHSRGFCPVKTAVTLGTTSPECEPLQAQLWASGPCGPQGFSVDERVWRLAWGGGGAAGLKPMTWAPPSAHQGRVWGKPLLRPPGASVLQVW